MPDPTVLPATTAREASWAADAYVSADHFDACSCWDSTHVPWKACDLEGHPETKWKARAARSVLLEEVAALTAHLVGPLRDGEAARLLRLVNDSHSVLGVASSAGGRDE
jgi:hypothetical protein